MKLHTLLAAAFCLSFQAIPSLAQQRDSKEVELAEYARVRFLTQAELNRLEQKARAGDADAQYWVGRAYDDGRLVKKDQEEARRWYLKAAEQGDARAQRLYGMGSVATNISVAERWMRRAGEQGDAEAALWLGVAYEQNWFGTTDTQEALKWYRVAAEKGDPDAQVSLGQAYEDGDGVDQNYELAALWYRKAAEHVPDLGGAGQGRHHLAELYMQGRGVPRDYIQAYVWFSLWGGKEAAGEANEHMNLEQIRQAERLMKEWKEEHRLKPEIAAALNVKEEL